MNSHRRQRSLVWGALLVVLACMPACARHPDDLAARVRDGDIIFHSSRSEQSALIRRATHSEYTHVGLIFIRNGRPEVLEAVGPVKYTPLAEWIARGEKGRCVVKRLCAGEHALTPEAAGRLRRAAESYLRLPYDRLFLWSDDRIYCSELVWKAYREATGLELGRLSRLGNWVADAAVRKELVRRHGPHPPLDAPVIAPVDIFEAEELCEAERR